MVNYANRGKELETLVDMTNKQYQNSGVALIKKIPTPIKIKNVSTRGLVTGWISRGEFVDYIGLYKGKFICFDAKQTKNKTSFPLANIEDIQLQYMKEVSGYDGAAFLLVMFEGHEIYKIDYNQIQTFIETNTRKSIPRSFFEKECQLIKSDGYYTVPYLKYI